MNLDPSERRGPNILASRRAQLIAGCGLLFILVLSFGGHQHVKSASPDGTWSTYLSSSSSNRANAQQQQSTPSSGSVQQSVGYRHTKERVARANELYDESIVRRKALIAELGGLDKIVAFPGDESDHRHRLQVLWDFLLPAWSCPHELERVGVTGDGGKWVCGMDRLMQIRNPIVYSYGVEHQSSFEQAILSRSPTAQIWAYDFSVTQMGPEIQDNPTLLQRVHFHPYRFDSYNKAKSDDNPETHTLKGMMDLNGHKFVDLLKVDVEGSEMEVLKEIIKTANGKPLPFGQLLLEIHAWNGDFRTWIEWWELLEGAGLRPHYRELNYQDALYFGSPKVIEYSFINIRGNHALVNDEYTR